MLFWPIDMLTNFDALVGMRGSERLCMDLIDRPEVIEKALEQIMGVFMEIYQKLFVKYTLPGPNGFDHLQCDFSYMISPAMFDRFALPCLEREAEMFNGRIFYHWDGSGALNHTDSLIASKNIYVLGYVPGAGSGGHKQYLDVYEKVQKGGKAIWVGGSPEDVKYFHKRLKPNLTVYDVWAGTVDEAEEILEWFVKNT